MTDIEVVALKGLYKQLDKAARFNRFGTKTKQSEQVQPERILCE